MHINWFKIICSLLLCLAAGGIGSFFTADAIPTWYAGLTKPYFNPPNWIFGPVWTTLYIMMGFALYRVWQKKLTHDKKTKIPSKKKAIIVFLIQLLINTLWSILFFGLQNPFVALLGIIVLWKFILYTIIDFYKIDQRAAWLLVPYLGWVTFAAILNFYIWKLN